MQDFLSELGLLGVTARLKRMNDILSASIKDLYKENGIEIEPSWHLIFLILKKKESMTMIEIAEALQLSQPALTKMITRMKNKGYVEVQRDQADSRKKNISLSTKAIAELPRFEEVWNAGQKSVGDILRSNPQFFKCLELFETEVKDKSFKERAIEHMKNG